MDMKKNSTKIPTLVSANASYSFIYEGHYKDHNTKMWFLYEIIFSRFFLLLNTLKKYGK